MPSSFFVTGTDTDCGKTLVSAALLRGFTEQGMSTAALKPVAAGCYEAEDGSLRNEDADALMAQCSAQLAYQQVNPITLREALSPHIAAEKAGKRISIGQLVGYCRGSMMGKHDVMLIEGAGGWRCPLNSLETLAALPKELNVPVVLVVGLKLGCLNHALLSAEAIARDGVRLAGWVANQIDPNMAEIEANIATLGARIGAPCLGYIPWLKEPDPALAAGHLNVKLLLNPAS